MRFRGLIFDLDGTLVHTKPEYRYFVVGNVLKEFGVNPVKAQIDRFWFQGNRNELIQNVFRIKPEKFWEKYHAFENAELRKKHAFVYEDVEFLRRFRQKGVRMGIVTGSPSNIFEMQMGLLEKMLFDSLVQANPQKGSLPKPHPSALQKCIFEMQLQNFEVAFIGNADEDILAARNAKIFSVFIDRKEHSFEMPMHPDFVITSLGELSKIL